MPTIKPPATPTRSPFWSSPYGSNTSKPSNMPATRPAPMPVSKPAVPTYRPYTPTTPGSTRPAPAPASKPAVEIAARPDPLAVTRANGGGFKPVDTYGMESEIRNALVDGADVPGRVQDGPTCGLYALGMVMDFFDKQAAKNQNPAVQWNDLSRANSGTRTPDSQRYLLEEAKKAGYTTQGEMFYASKLGELAQKFGYRATEKTDVTLADIQGSLDRGHPALVAFDVDNAGNPGLYGGKRAHWAVVEGAFKKDGVDYLVATHGWTGQEYVWRADELLRSMHQLNASDFPGAPKDLTNTLKARMIEIAPL